MLFACTMKTTLSSPFTLFFKIVFPCAWLGLGLVALINAFVELRGIGLIRPLFLVCVWVGISFAIFYWNNFPVKRVYLDDRFLHVSNYIKQVSIPLAFIDNVKATGGGSWWRWPPYRVVVTLKSTSEFGNEIKFVPGPYYKEVVRLLEQKLRASQELDVPEDLG
jgi:hypothetical protein